MDETSKSVTDTVLASFDTCPDPRLRTVVRSLVTHLHAFVAEVEPSLAEWERAVEFLTEVGQTCTDTRQEFILLSDVLGVSTHVEARNGTEHGTESTVLGPFHVVDSPRREPGANIDLVGGKQQCVVRGRVVDTAGAPIAGAEVDVWQCDEHGFYDVQQPQSQPLGNGRGLFRTDQEGGFWFRTVVPSHYPIPTDGPVGWLLGLTGRHPYRPAHIHFIVTAEGHVPVTTHVFVADSPYLDSDAVFAVRESLVTQFPESDDRDAAERFGVRAPFRHAEVELVLEPGGGGDER